MTVNFEEIKKFTSIASEWWDKSGKFKPLHEINPIRIKYILDKITKLVQNNSSISESECDVSESLKNISILDIGCGGGLVSIPLARLGADVDAIDAGDENIKIAKVKAEEENLKIHFEQIDSSELKLRNKKYDVILCLEVLEHVEDPEIIISDIKSMMKDTSIVILSTINKNLKSRILAIEVAENILNWVPKNTHEYNKFITPIELSKMAQRQELKVKELVGISYNIFSKKFELTEDLDINYMALLKHS